MRSSGCLQEEALFAVNCRRRAKKGYQKKVSCIPKSEVLVSPIAVVFDQKYLPVHVEEAYHLRGIKYAGGK
ncbi:hypothetical protein RHMOL_Rhmol01G0218900 [Rhododendron molle]|uniref:Uncharacterized protein n=1 Tax=Rhododendron molle TaxID=49168 RepID=A0ACC0Q5N9_RHOML|nr:hypothetical protein RHMOL_Rhmol01G0218900 [Rhododendron molle]